jgi:hypothetical protein
VNRLEVLTSAEDGRLRIYMSPPTSTGVLLFGFGALLHPSKIFDREPECIACAAPEHALSFRHRLGFATLEPLNEQQPQQHRSPSCAYGVVYKLRSDELDELKRRERGYDLQTIPVLPLDKATEGAELAEALAFISLPNNILSAPVAPTRRYADLVADGAEIRGLPADYVAWLKSEQESALDTGPGADKQTVPRRYYATRGAMLSWSFAGAWAAGCLGWPLADAYRSHRAAKEDYGEALSLQYTALQREVR